MLSGFSRFDAGQVMRLHANPPPVRRGRRDKVSVAPSRRNALCFFLLDLKDVQIHVNIRNVKNKSWKCFMKSRWLALIMANTSELYDSSNYE